MLQIVAEILILLMNMFSRSLLRRSLASLNSQHQNVLVMKQNNAICPPIKVMNMRMSNISSRSISITSNPKLFKKGTQRPTRIILVRHGESMGNVDESAYVKTPDWKVPLTEKGRQQASDAGEKLADIIGDGQVFFYYSPYKRTRETVDGLLEHIDKEQIISIREEPRISEQVRMRTVSN